MNSDTMVTRAVEFPELFDWNSKGEPKGPKGPKEPKGTEDARRVGVLRLLAVTPITFAYIFLTPEILSIVHNKFNARPNFAGSGADVFGDAGLICFMIMLMVTPVHTITGWKWHLFLRRYYGRGAFIITASDLISASLFHDGSFNGGFFNQVLGHDFLVAGTAAVCLMAPLMITSNKKAKRWLGRNWKVLHRLTYLVWVAIGAHLALLFSFHHSLLSTPFSDPGNDNVLMFFIIMSIFLLAFRVPAAAAWWSTARIAGAHRGLRTLLTLVVATLFLYFGLLPEIHKFFHEGVAALRQTPGSA